jgi:hypothetical protein
MQPVGEHTVPAGPLAVRWLAHEVETPRAGTVGSARLALENAGSATWRSHGGAEIQLSYHWLDERGNPIVWDGLRTAFERPVEPGERIELAARVRAPIPPAQYRLAFDLVQEHRFWFSELANEPLTLDIRVAPRLDERGLAVRVRPGEGAEETAQALSAQDERLVDEPHAKAIAYLAPGCLPAHDWSRRLLDAHAEGYAAVGGSIEPIGGLFAGRRASSLQPWAPGTGRNPAFAHPLLCPSLLVGVEPRWSDDVAGLPALEPPHDEPWIYDGRITLKARRRAGRRRG